MKDQLALDLAPDPPRAPRAAGLRSFVPSSSTTVADALDGEARANRQEQAVLDVFRESPPGTRYTPSQVHGLLLFDPLGPHPLIQSVRRAMTVLTRKGLLVHHPEDRRRGPHGASESVWSLR